MDERIVPFDESPLAEPSQSSKKVKIFGLFALIFALFLGAGALAFFTSNQGGKNIGDNPSTGKETSLADRTIIYGYWTSDNSVIKALDLSNNKTSILLTLPSNIKHVNIPFPNLVYYISETNLSDYGVKIIQKNLSNNSEKEIITADQDFGIDDYRISPNGNYIAVWMVALPSDSNQLQDGISRVYLVDINSLQKTLIYDEVSNSQTPINYPVGVSNSGQVFTDKFLPNSGAGWAYGMSVSNAGGDFKQEIPSMRNGTYGTQPVMSSDGSYFAFAGYSGNDGLSLDSGFRKAIVRPNTFEILNANTLERTIVDTGFEDAIYSGIFWDSISNVFIVSAIHKDATGSVVNSQLSFNPVTQTIQNLNAPQAGANDSNNVIGVIDTEHYIIADKVNGQSNLGNLGKSYAQLINNISLYNTATQNSETIEIAQLPFQLIDIKKGGFFDNLIADGSLSFSSDQLQLQTFVIKPTLAPVRERQQSERRIPNPQPDEPPPVACRELGYPQCNELLGTDYPVNKDIGDIGDDAFSDCIWAKQAAGEASGICSDSPLYLYGEKGKKVRVEIGTQVSNSNIEMQNNSFEAILDGDGRISVDSKTIESVEFDYVSKIRRLPVLSSGYVVSKDNLNKKILEIAKKFDFNFKEANDILKFSAKINSDYVFVSFYDNPISQEILPLYFNPAPDSYRNIVFYFKKLNHLIEVEEPAIRPVERKGFTAIEISYILD